MIFPSKSEVLDYIVLPKKLYDFELFKSEYGGCSDHRALIEDIKLKY